MAKQSIPNWLHRLSRDGALSRFHPIEFWALEESIIAPNEIYEIQKDLEASSVGSDERDNGKDQFHLPPAQGLYDPELEKDACGVGFIAHIKGEPVASERTRCRHDFDQHGSPRCLWVRTEHG